MGDDQRPWDLYVCAKQVDLAVSQYTRIADHFWNEGFFPKAAALYKKIRKVKPIDEPSLMRVGDISAQQGKLVDAKAAFNAVVSLRRKRGDANAVVVRLGAIDRQNSSLGAPAHRHKSSWVICRRPGDSSPSISERKARPAMRARC